jgi:hypothetical protein
VLPYGSYLEDGVAEQASRPDDQWINVQPSPTKAEPWFNTGVREPLNTPLHGDKSIGTTDLEYWGPTDWDMVRDDQKPAYLSNFNSVEPCPL